MIVIGLKLGSANITPAQKKESTTDKGNYRPKNKSSSLQMPVGILKNSVDVCLIPLTDQLNNIVNDCHWP